MLSQMAAISQSSIVQTSVPSVRTPVRAAVSEIESCRIYGSSYSGVSFGSSFMPDNLVSERRPARSRYQLCVALAVSLQQSCDDLFDAGNLSRNLCFISAGLLF